MRLVHSEERKLSSETICSFIVVVHGIYGLRSAGGGVCHGVPRVEWDICLSIGSVLHHLGHDPLGCLFSMLSCFLLPLEVIKFLFLPNIVVAEPIRFLSGLVHSYPSSMERNPDTDEAKLKENKKKDNQALYSIQQTFTEAIFGRISAASTAKEAWETL
ncbi:hypothetical protein Tsubulata_007384 [Turnera subulata]|uniref:Uncharacterized protein n=1 Tax=Turnera subulata TaxID=218843 RepID=A0A9Q0J5A8_9ROSI|nr:hypothetical protein Tsubulata_007384 [Turnera subulata]